MSDEEVDSVDCFHYKGSIDTDAQVDKEIAKLDPSQPGYEERIKLLELERRWQFTLEFWIDKEDHLLRQLKQYQDMVFIEHIGEDTEREEHTNAVIAYRFFDFNQPIQIEAPITDMVDSINLKTNISGNVGGKDLQHQEIHYEITVSNRGIETAKDVRVFVDSQATNQGLQTMEAEPTHRPVNLGPDEHETYIISWEYDITRSSKEELIKLLRETVFRATWIDEKGQQGEKVLGKGA